MAKTRLYLEVGFPTLERQDNISSISTTYTTLCTVNISLPPGAIKKEVSLIALITAMNNSATLQKIDVRVEERKDYLFYGWHRHFSENNCIALPALEGATASLMAISKITPYVDTSGSLYLRCAIKQSTAESVIYTTQYVLIYKYSITLD